MALHIENRIVDRTDNHPNKNFNNDLADFITIHETANPDAGASAHASWMYRDGGAPYSWHVTVDDSTTENGTPMVYQSFPWSSQCWHAGDGANGPGNTSSIGIELCVNNDLETFRTRVLDTAAELVAHLRKLGHGSQGIVQHKHWSGKNCPTRIIESDLWDSFLDRVATKEDGAKVTNDEIEALELSEEEQAYLESGFPFVSSTQQVQPVPQAPRQLQTKIPKQNTQGPVGLLHSPPSLIQGNRTLKKGAPELAATGSTGGLMALLNSVGVNIDIEVLIAVMVAVPPLLFAARRLVRDAIKTLQELRSSFS